MKPRWYVIANASEARVYERNVTSGELSLIDTLLHPESRMKGNELSSDRPGHNQSAGNGHGAYVEKSDPKQFEAERFAKEVSNFLNQQRNQNRFDDLCIAASPAFHGLLNKNLDKNVVDLIAKHIDKDLTHVKEDQLDQTLSNY